MIMYTDLLMLITVYIHLYVASLQQLVYLQSIGTHVSLGTFFNNARHNVDLSCFINYHIIYNVKTDYQKFN